MNIILDTSSKTITEEIKTAKATGTGSGGSGDTTVVKPWEQKYKKDYNTRTDWGRVGRSGW